MDLFSPHGLIVEEKDTYEILCKRPDGSCEGVRKVSGIEEAKDHIRLLNTTTPGCYLLFNLRTGMIED